MIEIENQDLQENFTEYLESVDFLGSKYFLQSFNMLQFFDFIEKILAFMAGDNLESLCVN